jgi:hypothetical protein
MLHHQYKNLNLLLIVQFDYHLAVLEQRSLEKKIIGKNTIDNLSYLME